VNGWTNSADKKLQGGATKAHQNKRYGAALNFLAFVASVNSGHTLFESSASIASSIK